MTEYQKFQLQWMIDHSYSLDDLMNELQVYHYVRNNSTMQAIFNEWQYETGFSGSIWPCESEWNDCERSMNHE